MYGDYLRLRGVRPNRFKISDPLGGMEMIHLNTMEKAFLSTWKSAIAIWVFRVVHNPFPNFESKLDSYL